MSNNQLKTKFNNKGYIIDDGIYDKFEKLTTRYLVFREQEVEIGPLDLEKEVEYEEESWSGDPDDYEPSYKTETGVVRMGYYRDYVTPTDEDICLFFEKEPQDITSEDCEAVDPEDFNNYLKEVYSGFLYDKAYREFYGEG